MIWICFILIMCIAIIYLGVGTLVAHHRFSRGAPHLDAPFNLYPVSILKPLKGVDSHIKENLESFFNLDYPQYEILFSVANACDPVVPVVEGLLQKYPRVNAKIIIGEIQVGLNPKINNLMKSYFESKYDLVLISDAQIRFRATDLKNIVGHMDTHVGIVTCPVIGIDPIGLGGHVQALELTTFVDRMLNFIDYFNHPVVLGKTMLIKKSVAARFGGLRTLANYVAEDYYAGVAVKKLGLNVTITSQPICEVVGYKAIADYAHRFIRWGRIRRSQRPVTFLFESIVCSLFAPLLGSLGFYFLAGFSFTKTLLIFVLFNFFVDILLIGKTSPRLLTRQFWCVWSFRQVLNTYLYIAVYAGNAILWRDRTLRLKKGGLIDMTTS